MSPKLENRPLTRGRYYGRERIWNSESICWFKGNIKEYCWIYPQLVEFELAGTVVVHLYLQRSILLEGKVTLFWVTLRSHDHIALTGWLFELEFGRIVHRWHFTYWYHDFDYTVSSSGSDIEVFLWTVTVFSITFIVSGGKFDRLINKLTTVSNYTIRYEMLF